MLGGSVFTPRWKFQGRRRRLVGRIQRSRTFPKLTRKEEKDVPKRAGNLYQKTQDREFIKAVLIEACRGRHDRRDVRRVYENLDAKTDTLVRIFKEHSFKPHAVRRTRRYDTSSQKWRDIKTVPFFPDACIQWVIIYILMEPVFMRGMDHYCCSSIPGRGGERIKKRLTEYLLHNYKDSKYAGQMDVHHYYDNISITRLMKKLRRRCKDEELLQLIELIIRSASEDGEHGLAIGLYICQWLANFFLEDVDRKVRESGLVRCYVRYMDNMTALCGNKRRLHKLRKLIEEELVELGLELKSDWQIFRTAKRPIVAVGYRFYGNGCIVFRKRTWLKARRQFMRVKKKQQEGIAIPLKTARGILSRIGNLKQVKSPRTIRRDYVAGVNINQIRRIVQVCS